jgi:hypothetical protein
MCTEAGGFGIEIGIGRAGSGGGEISTIQEQIT